MNIFSGTIKSKEKTEQTEEGTPEEGRNTNFYPFFDRLSRLLESENDDFTYYCAAKGCLTDRLLPVEMMQTWSRAARDPKPGEGSINPQNQRGEESRRFPVQINR
jgi:hypothetical protein